MVRMVLGVIALQYKTSFVSAIQLQGWEVQSSTARTSVG